MSQDFIAHVHVCSVAEGSVGEGLLSDIHDDVQVCLVVRILLLVLGRGIRIIAHADMMCAYIATL